MTAEPLAECKRCGGRLKRLIGAGAGVIFKGSGFYCTDYRSSAYTEAAKKEKSTPTAAATGGDSGSKEKGSRPAEKAASKSDASGAGSKKGETK